MARFFSRTPQDPFRFPDLRGAHRRARGLRPGGRCAAHGLDGPAAGGRGLLERRQRGRRACMLRHPGLLAGGALLRPMLPAPAPEGLDLTRHPRPAGSPAGPTR